MIYITGDTHGDFTRVHKFCQKIDTTREDILIILGDAAINYFGDERDTKRKALLTKLPITLFCIHGNHEMRPQVLESYMEQEWHGGIVYREEAFPNLLFAKDGELFDLGGHRAFVIGGAYSVDKHYRLAYGYRWFEDEQPSPEIKAAAEKRLEAESWAVDVVLSHTCPLKYEPREVFLTTIDQKDVDKSSEEWLDAIEDGLSYRKWYCGHYHTEKVIDRMVFMFEGIWEFLAE